MEAWLAEEFALDVPSAGEIREGWIVDRRHNEFLVDIGAKSEGIIPSQEIEMLDAATIEKNLAVGNKISVFVVNPEDHDGNIILSYQRAAEEMDWELASDALDSQKTQEVEVVGFNKGGFIVQFGSLRGFVPMSQQSGDNPRYTDSRDLQRACQKRVGTAMMSKVIEVDRPRNRLIFSERAADDEIREARRAKFFDNVQVGDAFEGRVVNVTDYGAFVDIGDDDDVAGESGERLGGRDDAGGDQSQHHHQSDDVDGPHLANEQEGGDQDEDGDEDRLHGQAAG
jgi:small subunit ribosomal protein S1